ncbi:hypothetical protein [Pontibacter liquoris]|uniref:hypothetical protein n=1 Tax=Pontibacter liquoris TaxID=2905677 RepID=UPI001FA6CEDE|nr:hypothetical protein [Pontibacter liquoris]
MSSSLKAYSIFLFILSVCLSSCTGSKPSLKEDNASTNAGINIDTFSEFPPEIEGCLCSFSNSKNDFESRKYIYVDDYQGNAFISINGDLKKFILSNSQKVSDEHYITTWTSEGYEVILDYKQVGQEEETWQQKGTMRVKAKGAKELVKELYGECGC